MGTDTNFLSESDGTDSGEPPPSVIREWASTNCEPYRHYGRGIGPTGTEIHRGESDQVAHVCELRSGIWRGHLLGIIGIF